MIDWTMAGVVLGAVTSAGGGITWLVRLEGKANGANAKYAEILSRFDKLEDRFNGLVDELRRSTPRIPQPPRV